MRCQPTSRCQPTTGAAAASGPDCSDYEAARHKRDAAQRDKDLPKYCAALSDLIELHPAKPPAEARLKCEAEAIGGDVGTWKKVRPDVIANLEQTFAQICR